MRWMVRFLFTSPILRILIDSGRSEYIKANDTDSAFMEDAGGTVPVPMQELSAKEQIYSRKRGC